MRMAIEKFRRSEFRTFLAAGLFGCGACAQAAVLPITSATVTYQTYANTNDNYSAFGGGSAGFPTGTLYNVRYNEGVSNQMFLGSVTVGGRRFDGVALAGDINIARATNATIKGAHHIVLYEQSSYSGTNIFLKSSYAATMEESLRSRLINHGADNVFSDVGDGNGNNNNIQRIDYLFPDGLPVHSHIEQRGFLVMDRGGNDRFKIAAITALDGNRKPMAFSTPVSVMETNWGASGISLDTIVLRGFTEGGDVQHPSADVDPQPLSGVFLNWQTLGLKTNDLFYGYALVGNDTTTNGALWVDVQNPVYFPTNTSPDSTFGGLDLISGGLMFYDEALNVTLGDRAWDDLDADGIQDAGEPGLTDVLVYVYDGASNLAAIVRTETNGVWKSPGHNPGSYCAKYFAPTGYEFTARYAGTNAALDSDADLATGRTAVFAMTNGQTNLTLDAGLYRRASLGDFTWEDSNGNGQQDGGEPALSNVVVRLYTAASNLVGTTTSSVAGAYAFTNLAPGSYFAGFTPPAGHLFTTANAGADATDSDVLSGTNRTALVTLVSGQAETTVDAGFYRPASLGDFTWVDANGNGQQDGGEPALSNVVVRLYTAASNLVGTTTSSVAGAYAFTNLAPGSYFAGFTPPAGHLFTTANAGADATDSDVLSGTNRTALVTLVSGQAETTVDAGFYRPASLGDFTWVDANGNGQQDGGEIGLSNVVVTLYNAASNAVGTRTTSVAGAYAFTNLAPGVYFAGFAPPAGYVFATADAGDDATDSDAVSGTGFTALRTLASGQTDATVDAGFVRPAAIGNFTWVDANYNGQQDGGEPGLANVVVRLYDAASNVVATTTSSLAGAYAFTNLSAGAYFAGFTAPAGYSFTTANAGADATDSDADPSTGFTAPVVLSGGQTNHTVDAGFYNPASVSLKLFKSSSLAGNWNLGETNDYYLTLQNTGTVALAGVALTDALPPGATFVPGSAAIVQLTAPATNSFAETVSDGFGAASYGNNDGSANWIGSWNEVGDNASAAGGDVLVRVAGGTNALVFENTNADNDHVTRTNRLANAAERVYTNCTLSFAYRRQNWDSGDSFTFYVSTNGFAGQSNLVFAVPTTAGSDASYVSVTTNLTSRMGSNLALRLRAGGSFGAGDRISIDYVTFTNSGYAVSSVPVALYGPGVTVSEVSTLAGATPASLLSNYTLAAGTTVTVRLRATLDVPLAATQFVNTAVATNPATPPLTATVTNASVANAAGDRVWFDADGDGLQDGGEPGLAGVTVRIYGADSNLIATTTSGVAGAYGFANLPSGTYFLEFAAPADHLPALQDQGGNDALDSDIDPGTGRTAIFSLSGGTNDTSRDAGFHQPPASIGDFVWRDANLDGLQSGGSETGMPGVAVRLYGASSNLVAATNTSAAGFYNFANLPPATYFLEFTAPAGFMFALQHLGSDDAVDSDVSRTTGRTAPFFLPVGAADTRWDAGLVEIVQGLRLTKTSDASSCLAPGDAITYVLTVANTGNVTQTGIAVEDVLPAGLAYVPDSAQVVISNAAIRTVRDEFNTGFYSGQDGTESWGADWQENDPYGTAGPVGNYVGVTNGRLALHYAYVGSEAVWRQADLSAETNATLSFDWETAGLDANEYLAVLVASSPGGPFTQLEQFGGTAGGTASYDITAYISTGTTVRFEAAPGTENWESGEYGYLDNIEMASTWTSVSTNFSAAPPHLLSGQTLMPGGSLTATFRATVAAPSVTTQLVNTASVSSPVQPALEASTTNCVVFADVGVRKFVTDAAPDMLETIGYILVASNNGPAAATGVVLTDVLPAQVQYHSHSNGAFDAGTGAWTIGALAVNASTTLQINVTVREGTADASITNTVAVTGRDLFDPVPDNDSSSVVIVPKGWSTVGDRAWLDNDADGIQDAGEPGLAGVTVRIYGAGSNLLAETTTGTDGNYSFTNLFSGAYFLEFVAPADHVIAPRDRGGDDALDSDIDSDAGRTAIFSLGGGTNDTNWDAGFYRLAAIGDRAWDDVNRNGQQDAGEPGLSAVMVRLYNAASNVVGVRTTSVTGAYMFGDLVPGTYFVGFTAPAGYRLTAANAGDEATDSDPLADTGFTATSTLSGGQTDLSVDAGFYQVVSIGDRVWFDANRDGLQSSGETNGYANVSVALIGTNGNIVAETVTDANGYYLFEDIPGGTYVVRFDLASVSTNEVVSDFKAGDNDETDSDAISGMTGDYAWTAPVTVGGQMPGSGGEETHLAIDLGITTKDSTRAAVAEVWGEWTAGAGHVAWRTESEFGTAGFFVYRHDPETGAETRLGERLVPSAFNEAGSVYGLVDPEAVEGAEGTYRLEEIELSGDVRDLGIHGVRFAAPAAAAKREHSQLAAAKAVASAPRSVPMAGGPSSVLKIHVKDEGIHGVSLVAIAAGMGLAPEEVRRLAEAGGLKLTAQGRPVPVLFDAPRDRLLFHAAAPARNWYVHDAAYLISAGEGLAMPRRAPQAAAGAAVFPARLHFEEDRFLFSMTQMPEDFYFWAGVVSQTNDLLAPRFPLDLTGFAGGDLKLKVRLMGWSATTNHPDHLAEISFNGVVAGSIAFDDQETAEAELTIPGAAVADGLNTVMVNGAMKPGQSHSFFVVDWIEASFDRELTPRAPVASFRAGEAPAVSAGAYADPLALALDAAGRPTWIADENGELPAKAWAVASGDERFALVESSAVPMLDPVPAAADAWFMSETNRIDYLVIVSRELASAAQELADYRASQGLRAGVAVFEDACDLLAGGLRTPEAVPALLRRASATWAQPPKMVVLAGNGHYDYLGANTTEPNHLPPMLVQTPDGVCAADGLLADTSGDSLPDVAIGRLPALTAADLAAMIAKIKAYEAGFGEEWQNQLVLVADQSGSAGRFSDSNTKFAELATAPYAVAKRIDLDAMAVGPARAELMDSFRTGAGFIHYTGHGGLFSFGGRNILSTADVGAMGNTTRPPIAVALSCLLGRYELPATDSLGELLMRRSQGGAVALLAPSGLSFNAPATELGEAFYRAALRDGVGTLGLAFLQARRSLPGDLATRETFAVYNLLGDPALRIAGNAMTNGAPASAEVVLRGLAQIYDGQPRAATAGTEPAGLAVRFTYDGSPVAPTAAGSYAVVGTVADDVFTGSATGTLVVSKAVATVTLDSLAQTYDGYPRAATATTEPAGLAVEFTYDGSAEAPTEAGQYAVIATVTDDNYSGAGSGVLTVAKASATVALAGLEQTYDGTPRQATATTVPAGLAVAIAYDGAAAAPVHAGRYAVSAAIDDPNYAGSAAGALAVAPAVQTIDFPAIADSSATDEVRLMATAASGLPVSFAVASGPAAIADGTRLAFTGAGEVSIVASQAGNGDWRPAPDVIRTLRVSPLEIGKTDINVREGGEGRVFLRLSVAPTATVVATVTRVEGDPGLWIKSGGVQTFTPANWNVWRIVTLAANEDANGDGETATFRIAMPGRPDRFVDATALDDEIGENLALAARGTTIAGPGSVLATNLIDGVHAVAANYGYAVWNTQPPGTMILDLKTTATVSRVRLLNYDWNWRASRYVIESSLDGTAWTMRADASADERSGWDDWEIDGAPMRYLRFTGLSNSANHAVCVNEWEVYGSPFAKAPAMVVLGDLIQTCDGTPRVVSATTDPAGLAVSIAYNGSAAPPVGAGAYAVVATVEDPFHAGSATGTLVVAKRPAKVVLSALEQAYDGSPRIATVTTEPAGLAVSITYDGNAAAPLGAGTYAVAATVVDSIYAGSAAGALVVSKADQTIEFPEFFEVFANEAISLAATARSGLPVTYAVTSGPAVLDGTTLTFAGVGTVTVAASQAGDGNWNPAPDAVRTFEVEIPRPVPRFSKTAVNVREGGEGRVFMRLNMAPAAPVVVRMTPVEGGTNLWIKSGGVQTFTPANWNVWRAVTLAANEDKNDVGETAVFRVAMPGARDRTVTATALDDDIGANLALASAGATLAGFKASGMQAAIDGVHTVNTNYAYTTWAGDPPGTLTLDLKAIAAVSRVRLLNYDWNYRVHRYRIESSQDGAAWTTLADASAGEHSGWEDWPAGGAPLRYLRFTGLSNSANSAVCIAEWEVVGERVPWRQDQTIDFPAIGDKLTTDAVGLSATASSGLPVSFAVAAGPATISGGTNLSFTGTGAVRIVAFQAGDADWHPAPDAVQTFAVSRPALALEFSKPQVNVREGGEGRVFVRLSAAPVATVVMRMSAAGGDPNIWIKSGSVQTFTPANWSVWRTVTLAANQDANDRDETASFRATLPGAADRMLEATALDDDRGENLALASAGAVISGTRSSYAPQTIDGVHLSNANYGYTVWTNEAPGTLTLELPAAAAVSNVRLLNWDFSLRTHRYTIESSADGAVWTMLADAGTGEHSGWEDWAADGRTMRYLRFTGLSNSANSVVCIAEWEVYGTRLPAAQTALARENRSAIQASVAAREESEPVMVLTGEGPEDESGWAAVDGDSDTAWIGGKAGDYLLVEYAPALEMSVLEVDTAEGSPADIQVLYSRDGEEWLPLPDDLATHPVMLNYLWLVFPENGAAEQVPQVLEIQVNP